MLKDQDPQTVMKKPIIFLGADYVQAAMDGSDLTYYSNLLSFYWSKPAWFDLHAWFFVGEPDQNLALKCVTSTFSALGCPFTNFLLANINTVKEIQSTEWLLSTGSAICCPTLMTRLREKGSPLPSSRIVWRESYDSFWEACILKANTGTYWN